MREQIPDFSEENRETFNKEAYEQAKKLIVEISSPFIYYRPDEENKLKDDVAKLQNYKGILKAAYLEDVPIPFIKNEVLFNLQNLVHFNRVRRDNPNEDSIVKFSIDLFEELQPQIVKDMKNQPTSRFDPARGLSAFASLIEDGNPRQQELGINSMAQFLDEVEAGLSDKDRFYKPAGYLGMILKRGNESQYTNAAIIVTRNMHKYETANTLQYPRLLSLAIGHSSELEAEGFESLSTFLRIYDLSPTKIIDAWAASTKPEKFGEAVEVNTRRIIEIEHDQPGISKFLNREFGITDFGRYPPELLIQQYKEQDNNENPYGVIVYPRSDHNGAFYQNGYIFKDLLDKLDGEFSLRVVECESKIDIARALIKFDRRYNPGGKGHKISLAIIGGHGSENTIKFGGQDERHRLRIQDLMGSGIQNTSRFFEEGPTIILASCSTGANKGIGQEMSEKIGAKVIAPKEPTNLTEIQVGRKRGGRWRFNARYWDKTEKAVYMGRENIPT